MRSAEASVNLSQPHRAQQSDRHFLSDLNKAHEKKTKTKLSCISTKTLTATGKDNEAKYFTKTFTYNVNQCYKM